MNEDYDIILEYQNELYYRIIASSRVMSRIRNYFSLRAPGFIFNPLYKNGLWNGFISLVKNNLFPRGLLTDLQEFAKDSGYRICIPNNKKQYKISEGRLQEIIDSIQLTDLDKKKNIAFDIKLRDYQELAVKLCINNQHQLIVSQTSTGKTLMVYTIIRVLQEAILFDKKIMMIVPSINLVEQAYKDFKNYSIKNGWDVDKYCTRLHSKTQADFNKQILITTWQSLMGRPASFFAEYEAVILDEAHKIGKSNTKESKEIEKEINLCINAKYLLGFTGTLPEELLYRKKIQGFFGNPVQVTTYKESIEAGNISDLRINALQLNYTSGLEGDLRNYKNEKSYIMGSARRNEFIKKLLLKNKGNQLLLFTEIKKHAKIIYESIQYDDRFKDYNPILLDSHSSVSERERVKSLLETTDNVIVFGTYALLGTGWSVNNLWNIIFVSPLKSKISVLQSIGRGLRLIKNKEKVCQIWDIIDKFEYKNIIYRHWLIREKYYKENEFNVKLYNFENKSIL